MSPGVITVIGALAGALGGFLTAVYTTRAATQSAVLSAQIEAERAIRAAAEDAQRDLERRRSEFMMAFAEARRADPGLAQSIAQQTAVGVLAVDDGVDRQRFFLPPGCRITAGRDEYNDIVVEDSSFSRTHMAFVAEAGSVYVEDLGSANGVTWGRPGAANNELIRHRALLSHGDAVSVGMTTFTYVHLLTEPPPAG